MLAVFTKCREDLARKEADCDNTVLKKIEALMSRRCFEGEFPVDEFLQSRLPEYVMGFLGKEFRYRPENLSSALSILCNLLGSVDTALLERLLSLGYLEECESVLGDKLVSYGDWYENMLWGVANLSGSTLELRDAILSRPLFHLLLSRFDSAQASFQTEKCMIWFLSNLLRGYEYPPLDSACDILTRACKILARHPKDKDVMLEAAWAAGFFLEPTTDSDKRMKHFLSQKAIPYFCDWFNGNSQLEAVTLRPILRIFGNMIINSNDCADMILQHGIAEVVT